MNTKTIEMATFLPRWSFYETGLALVLAHAMSRDLMQCSGAASGWQSLGSLELAR